MSKWTSKYAIMRDLSKAQGSKLPIDIHDTVGVEDRPPSLKLKEETEEEYYRRHFDGGDVHYNPDLGQIQNMLRMVHNIDSDSDSDNNSDNLIITKPNTSKNKVNVNIENVNAKENRYKKRSERNVAMMSLLKTTSSDTQTSEQLKLLKPKDLMPKSSLPSAITFKKKSVVSPTSKVIVTATQSTQASTSCPAYVPSPLAEEYYKKYLERSQLKQQMQDTIWTKAEKAMKEIERKRVMEEEICVAKNSCVKINPSTEIVLVQNSLESDSTGDEDNHSHLLHKHRHGLTEPCLVCEVVKKAYPNLRTDQDCDSDIVIGTSRSPTLGN